MNFGWDNDYVVFVGTTMPSCYVLTHYLMSFSSYNQILNPGYVNAHKISLRTIFFVRVTLQ
jgi:hypothetical protein